MDMKKNKLIIILAALGLALTILVQGYILPEKSRREAKYNIDQKSPETQDLKSIMQYKNKYMGNFSNISALFGSLPLGDTPKSFRLFSERLTAEVDYKETEWQINENDRNRTAKIIIYNSTAAFALIDNLEEIEYNFTGSSYKVKRADFEGWYGVKMSALLNENVWKNKVQTPLNDDEYIKKCIRGILLLSGK